MPRRHAKLKGSGPDAIPTVWLLTDERVDEAGLMRAIRRLPHGAAIVLRHYSLGPEARRGLFDRVRKAARRRQARLLLAGEARDAVAWGADGHHGFDRRQAGAGHNKRPWLHSAPVHSHRQRGRATSAGADVLLISPLFTTRSHPGASSLGGYRFAALAQGARGHVIALGGVWPRHMELIRRLGATGFAAIDGLSSRRC